MPTLLCTAVIYRCVQIQLNMPTNGITKFNYVNVFDIKNCFYKIADVYNYCIYIYVYSSLIN